MAPPSYLIMFLALILVASLVFILVASTAVWMGGKEPAPRGKLLRRRVTVVILGIGVVSSSFVAAAFGYSPGPCCGISLRMRVVDSSGGFTIDDFSVTLGHSHNRYLQIESHGDYVLIDGMAGGDVYPIRLDCNRTPIFWGQNNLTLRAYVSSYFFILAFANSTGDSDMVTLYLNKWPDSIHVYRFGFGAEWVDIEVIVSEKQY